MSGAVAAGCRPRGEGDLGCPRGTAASGAEARPERNRGRLGLRQPREAREVALAREPLTGGASVIPDDKSPCEGAKHRAGE